VRAFRFTHRVTIPRAHRRKSNLRQPSNHEMPVGSFDANEVTLGRFGS
jgi:hypothetical protein